MRISTISALLVLAGSSFASAAPVLQYNFDETGTQAFATGTGSASGQPVLNISGSGAARGAAGSGVSGKASDRAFDNTNSSGIFGGGGAYSSVITNPLSGQTSFTLTGWYRLAPTAQPIGAQASLIEDINYQASSTDQGGFGLTGATTGGSGALRLRVNEVTGVESAPGTYAEVGQYVNFAVTYDGTNVKFYKGLIGQPVALVGTVAYSKGAVAEGNQPLIAGISQGGSSLTFSPFNGLIDDLGIYNTALTLPQLESLRVSAVPEPTTLAALAGGGLVLLRRRSRRQA